MKRIFAVLLIIALLAGLAVIPAAATETELVIDSRTDPFPADTTIDGDLILTGDCPETVILINVVISGTLRIESDHPITVRFQGDSSCQRAEILTKASLIGGSFGHIEANTASLRFEDADAQTMNLSRENSMVTMAGTVEELTVSAENIFVGGAGRAEKAIVDAAGCTLRFRRGETIKNVEDEADTTHPQESSIQAVFDINPTVSPAQSVVDATVTFTNVPKDLAGDYRIYWYIGDTLSYYEWNYTLEEGATLELHCSVHFDGVMNKPIPVWVRLVSNEVDNDTVLRFVTSTLPVDYSTARYDTVESSGTPYEIHLLRNQGVILVYGLDEKGAYTNLVNAFACSVGYFKETALGDFEIGLQMRWGSLMGDVWGQYCSQFNNNQLFHSVPYLTKEINNIEYWEYAHLGEPASSGCVRLCVADAKWIYDHCWPGTPVKVYDSNTCPIEKPIPVLIREDNLNRGWDPTDPDPENPTRATEVPIITHRNYEIIHPFIRLMIN